jgi:Regulatory subunit of type II PKA R-subunit
MDASTTEAKSAVKYSKEFEIPADFPEILRDLTREILRENPSDINKFGRLLF